MIRQYIGARYTPKFSGVYDPTQQYENLEVVDNGSGTTYISKKVVPPNTPLTDTEYWAVYGASSGAILDLQTRTTALENDNINIKLDITQLQGSVLGIQSDLDDLRDEIEAQSKRRIIIISDSYGLERGSNTPWTEYFQTISGLSSSDYFTWSEGSMGFNRTGDGGHTAQTLLTAHASEVSNPNEITDVVFGLGLNDMNALTGLDEAIANCITYTKTTFPKAKIWIGYIGNQKSKATAVFNNYIASVNAYKDNAIKNGAIYISDVEYVMHNWDFFQSDGIHPTSNGCREIASFVNSFMLGGASYGVSKTCTFTSSYLNTTYASIRQTMEGAISRIYLVLYGFANAVTIGAGLAVKIGSINNPLLGGSGGDSFGGEIFITVSNELVPFKWFVYDGDLYLQNLNSSVQYTIALGTTVRFTSGDFATIIC